MVELIWLCRTFTGANPNSVNHDRQACSGYYTHNQNNLYSGCSSTSWTCYFAGMVANSISYATFYRTMTAQMMRTYFP